MGSKNYVSSTKTRLRMHLQIRVNILRHRCLLYDTTKLHGYIVTYWHSKSKNN